MRWLYPDPADKREAAARAAIDKQIDAWWRAFAANCAEIRKVFKRQSNFDLVAFMREELNSIDDRIMWEFGPGVKKAGNERLVLTPESDHELEPLTRRILARAPKIEGWEFHLYRLSEGVNEAITTVEQRCGGNLRGASVRCTLGQGNLVDVLFHMPDRNGDENDARHAAFIGAESLFGEQRLTFWTGVIDAVDDKGKLKGWVPIEKSQATYEALVQSMRDRLPDKPVYAWAANASWIGFKHKIEEADDYATLDDLLICSCAIEAAVPAFPGGRLFASERFSKLGEVFGFIKLDCAEIEWSERVKWRQKIEDELTQSLESAKVAGMWGGGTGARYGYTLLAFNDVQKAANITQAILRKHKVAKRSWIQFLDATLADEWIGIYPDSPPPPLKSREE